MGTGSVSSPTSVAVTFLGLPVPAPAFGSYPAAFQMTSPAADQSNQDAPVADRFQDLLFTDFDSAGTDGAALLWQGNDVLVPTPAARWSQPNQDAPSRR